VNLPTPTPASNIDTKAYAETAALMHWREGNLLFYT
jgi:hypothetical protein